jgi:hypothetical protein
LALIAEEKRAPVRDDQANVPAFERLVEITDELRALGA